MNGLAIDGVKQSRENPTCQDSRTLKSAGKYAQEGKHHMYETIFRYTKLNVMSEEMFKATTNTMPWKPKLKFI